MTNLTENLLMRLEEVYKLEERTVNNDLIASYYETYANRGNNFEEKAKRLRKCGRSFFFNEYNRMLVADLKKIYLCKDSFCINCQRFKSVTRVVRYTPILEQATKEHDLYMLTLTATNCSDLTYDSTVDRMLKAYYTLHRYLTGNAKIRGYDFSHLGYAGSVRGFETTFNTKRRDDGQEYHPHIHSILALSKNVYLNKNTLNDYSESYKDVFKEGKKTREKVTRAFSQLEIDIQKIWYLLINNQKVTAKAINNLDVGYSCTLDRADEKAYVEVFKYAVKSFDDNNMHLETIQWRTLQQALLGRQTIQGYGIFRSIQDAENIDQETALQTFDAIITALNFLEKPKYDVHKHLWQVKEEMLEGKKTFINRKAVLSLSQDDHHEIQSKIVSMIDQRNKGTKHKINVDEFFDKVRGKIENRKLEKAFEILEKKKLQKEYLARHNARKKWVNIMLKEYNIDRASPLYASTVLSLKIEFNNLHPRQQQVDRTGSNLPF